MSILNKMSKVLPYRITKRIGKTGEGRSGDEIYKRRNTRSYRGLMQYVTWKKLLSGEIVPNILSQYGKGCVVWISPKDYFGDNYPNKSNELNSAFILGKTGFIYYKSKDELTKYPPLETWKELFELSTKGKAQDDDTWIGDYCLNVKNANPKRVSEICKDKEAKISREELLAVLQSYDVNISNYKIPAQCGIGNYDFDYATDYMIENVKIQMLFLILICEDMQGIKFRDYLKANYTNLLNLKHDKTFKQNIESPNYDEMYAQFFAELKSECEQRGLLDFNELQKINAWDKQISRPICPLCSKPMVAKDFFEEVEQAEGRRVQDNTQRAIVLMHVKALRSEQLNHKTYNLGWGHIFCNAIQGDKDLITTIEELERIVRTYKNNTNIN